MHISLPFLQRIPDKFVRDYITGENLNSNTAIILSPLGKSWRVELDKDQSGVFLGGGWLQFLSFHGISRGDVVIFRYEGNLVFKISVFGPNGRQKDFKAKGISIHQGEQAILFFVFESPSVIVCVLNYVLEICCHLIHFFCLRNIYRYWRATGSTFFF